MALDGYISTVSDGSGEVVRAVALQRAMPRPGSLRLATGLGRGKRHAPRGTIAVRKDRARSVWCALGMPDNQKIFRSLTVLHSSLWSRGPSRGQSISPA